MWDLLNHASHTFLFSGIHMNSPYNEESVERSVYRHFSTVYGESSNGTIIYLSSASSY